MPHIASNKQRVFGFAVAGLFALLTALFFLSFLIGGYPLGAKAVWDILTASLRGLEPYWESAAWKVVFQVRIPRILLAVLVGGGLSVSGASYQTLFKNPMVSPDILGVSAGAGFALRWPCSATAPGAKFSSLPCCWDCWREPPRI